MILTYFHLKLLLGGKNQAGSTQTIAPSRNSATLQGRVLVVDDEPSLGEYLKEVLQEQGLEVVVSTDSQKALSLLKDSHFDLLLTDQTMPGQLGTELALLAKVHRPGLRIEGYSLLGSQRAGGCGQRECAGN